MSRKVAKKISVVDSIKRIKAKLIDEGAHPDTLMLSLRSYNLLHSAMQDTLGKEILVLETFDDLKILVHPKCSDDQIYIIDSNCFGEKTAGWLDE